MIPFHTIKEPSAMPATRRLLSETQNVSRDKIVSEKLIALNDELRSHLVIAELMTGGIALFTDLSSTEDFEHDPRVEHVLRSVVQKYPSVALVGYFVPSKFIGGLYAHTLGSVVYDDRESDTWQEIDRVFAMALRRGVSDIFLHNHRTMTQVRFLIHSFNIAVDQLPYALGDQMARALYRSAPGDAQDRNFDPGVAQETSFERGVNGEMVRFRYQHIPVDGERYDVTLRLLRLSDAQRTTDFPSLGFLPQQIPVLKRVALQPKGLVLMLGPTGSGKSTSLKGIVETYDAHHQGLHHLREVSNPVEYAIRNMRSTNVVTTGKSGSGDHKRLFVDALRAQMRMNPHLLLVGEIRDKETAEIVVDFALTGHKVVSSSHAATWIETFPRFRKWTDNDPSLYGTVFFAALISQELLPSLCPGCCVSADQAGEEYAEVLERVRASDPTRFDSVRIRGPGCEKCNEGVPGIGGRIVVATIVLPSKKVMRLLREVQDEEAVEAWAASDVPLAGFTMREHALEHVLSGKVDPLIAQERVELPVPSVPRLSLVSNP